MALDRARPSAPRPVKSAAVRCAVPDLVAAGGDDVSSKLETALGTVAARAKARIVTSAARLDAAPMPAKFEEV